MSLADQWARLCAELQCSGAVRAKGDEMLTRLTDDRLESSQGRDVAHGRLAAAAYMSSQELGTPVSVRLLVKHLSLHIKDIFFRVDEHHGRLHPGREPPTKALKRQYVFLYAMHAKWRKLHDEFFPDGVAGAGQAGADGDELRELSKQFGWTLFLLLHAKVATRQSEMVPMFGLLASTIHLLAAHLPAAARTSQLWRRLGDGAPPPESYPLPPAALDGLYSLCGFPPGERPDASLVAEVAAAESSLRAALGLPTLGESGTRVIAGLLGPGTLRERFVAADAAYAACWAERGLLLDGRLLLDRQPDAALGAPSSVAASPMGGPRRAGVGPGTPGSGGGGGAPPLTPLRGPNPNGARIPGTPITSGLVAESWLRTTVAPLAAAPDEKLKRFYGAVSGESPEAAVKARLSRLGDALVAHVAADASDGAREHADLATKLYYRLLVAFLESEEKRLKQSSFGQLLGNDAFHTALYACCVEAVAATLHTEGLEFPAVLAATNLHAFDFFKVIEPFVRHEPTLPPPLKSHFKDVEDKILESLAWADDSPLHELMEEGAAAAAAAAQSPGPNRAMASLEVVIKKVRFLAAARVNEMCARLVLPEKLMRQVWGCVKHAFEAQRALMRGRHLDQLVMCSIYGVCKVNKHEITFRHIIDHYRKQADASPAIFRQVRMGGDHPPADIISFYNQLYIPAMKQFLMAVVAQPPLDPPSHPATSPHRVSASAGGGRDITISNPRMGSHNNTMSPMTRSLYSFGNTPHVSERALHHINAQVNGTGAGIAGAGAAEALAALSRNSSGAMGPPVGTPTRDGDKRGYDGGGEGAVQKRMRWMEQEGGDEERRSSSQSSHEGSSQG